MTPSHQLSRENHDTDHCTIRLGTYGPRSCWINQVRVKLAGFRGKGYGTIALQALVDRADVLGVDLYLSPRSDNWKRQYDLEGWYRSFGFGYHKGMTWRRKAMVTA